jgi:DNA-binding transcriptional ArsR family regulator
MRKKDNLKEYLVEDEPKIKFNGIYVPNMYVFDKDLNSNMKFLLSFLIYIDKYYGDRIIKPSYLSSVLGLSESTISRELKKLESLEYIKSEVVTYKNITLGKKYYVKVKPKDKN